MSFIFTRAPIIYKYIGLGLLKPLGSTANNVNIILISDKHLTNKIKSMTHNTYLSLYHNCFFMSCTSFWNHNAILASYFLWRHIKMIRYALICFGLYFLATVQSLRVLRYEGGTNQGRLCSRIMLNSLWEFQNVLYSYDHIR